uniref:BTB domain-containing protein n=1 Tax=Angiostrongylus cantonensis TaxID=6313 RepID=A0A0K0CZH0_ANGCA
LGDEDVVRQLLSFDANAFRSTMEYRKTSVRSVGSPSALAAACARGHSRIVDIFISRQHSYSEFKTLPNDIQLALQEAIYYAIETGRLISAVQIWESVPDLPWSAYIWARALQFATERGERKFATRLLTNFSPVMIAAENVEYCTLVVDGEIVYAHRIMLFTASERFKELLRSPSGTVDITDIPRSSFLAMLRFIYSRTLPELSVSALCCLYAAGEVYVMPSLCTAILADFVRILNPQNVAFIYQFAIVHNAAFLLRRCEEFLLTKLDVLVTYTKIRDMIKCHSNDYDVCEVLSKKLLSVISSTFKE